MDFPKFSLQKDPFINKIYKISQRQKFKLYLVGGFLRDLYIGRLKKDYDLDFATEKNAIKIARFFANKLKCGFVVLDKVHGTARVVYQDKNARHTIDFSDFRAKTLKEDLYKRDFTINTIALSLDKIKELGDFKKSVIDYFHAFTDIDNKKIKIINKDSFDDDPLRILRAFSLSAVLGFAINKPTLDLIRKKRDLLKTTPGERINEELFKILSISNSTEIFKNMDRLKVLEVFIPQIKVMYGVRQGPYHHLNVWRHSLETLRQLELHTKQLPQEDRITAYLVELITASHSRFQLIKLAALLHDIGKPESMFIEDGKTKFHGHERIALKIIEAISKRIRLSTKETELINKIVLWHLRPGYLADSQTLTNRARFRFFRDTQNEAISVLLVSLADQRATRGPKTFSTNRRRHERVVSELIKEYFLKSEEEKPPRLITGHDLIKNFGLKPSPLIGKTLAEIEEAQAVGLIRNKCHALERAERFIKKNK